MTKLQPRRRIVLRAVAAALSAVSLAAIGNSAHAVVTAAVVDLDRTTIGGALEAELIRAPNIQWVERTRLDLVLEEKRLQSAFSPEGAAARLELGKLLSADALVLIRRRVETNTTAGGRGRVYWTPPSNGPVPNHGPLLQGLSRGATSPATPAATATPHGTAMPQGTATPHGTAPRPTAALPQGTALPRGTVIRRTITTSDGTRISIGPDGTGAGAPRTAPGYEIVVCETHRGLRTMSLVVVENAAQPLDVKRLAATVLERVAKAGEPIREVYTVPPLIGRDLSYAYAHLQRSYAEVITGRLLALPGVAVVETAEARALAAERVVAGDPAGCADFAAPIFITGEFRHSGEGGDARVRIQATSRRGEAIVGRPFDRELRSEEVAAALTEWVDGLAGASPTGPSVAGRPAPPVDRKAEAARLFERAKDLLACDNWDEAAAVAETGLLFDPDDLPLRRLAYEALSRRFHDYTLSCRVRLDVWPPLREAFLRMCDHLDFLVRNDGKMTVGIASPSYWQTLYFGRIRGIRPPATDEVLAIHAEISRKETEAFQRFFKIRLERGFHTDAYHFLRAYLAPLPPEQLHSEMVRHILEYPPGRDILTIAPFLLHDRFSWVGVDLNPKLAILRDLKTHTERPDLVNMATREEAETLRRQAKEAQAARDQETKPFADMNRPGAPYRQIEWKIRRPAAEGTAATFETVPAETPLKFVPIGPNLDAARFGGELFFIREPGILDPVLKLDGLKSFVYEAELGFDGRYLWTSIGGGYRGIRHLLVVEPETGRTWKSPENFGYAGATNDDGRYDVRSSLNLTVLGPREAFIVARRGRTLLARVRFDPEAAEPFTLVPVLECPETRDEKAPESWRNPRLSFTADYVTPIPPAAGGDARYVLIGRGRLLIELARHPLLVDLRTNQVEIVELPMPPIDALLTGLPKVAEHGGQAWFTVRGRNSGDPQKYFKFDPVTRRSTLIDGDSATGIVLFLDGETHVIGDRWWKKGPRDAKFRRVTPIVPWFDTTTSATTASKFDTAPPADPPEQFVRLEGVYRSNHHGVIVCVNRPTPKEKSSRFYYLELDLPAAAATK